MSVVTPYIENLHKMSNNIERIAKHIVEQNLDFIYYLIKEEQLGKGINSDGNIIGRYKWTTEKKSKDPMGYKPNKPKTKGQPFNFDWTGDFINKIVIKSEKDSFSIFSRDAKWEMLENKYGKGAPLLKLTEKNNKTINEEVILPKLHLHILNNLFNLK